jgi:hypothetical protein
MIFVRELDPPTDAISRSGAKWNESVWMPTDAVLRKKSFRLESIRFRKNLWVAMGHTNI